MSKFTIPDGFLSSLNEFSKDGFVLFLFNQSGQPEFYMACDSTQSAMALHSYISNWSDAIREVNTSNLIDSIGSMIQDPDGGEDPDGYEDGGDDGDLDS